MAVRNNKYYYFIGIGGIGMSALARYLKAVGNTVAGYDRTATPLTEKLAEEGIDVFYSQKINDVPQIYLNPRKSIIVYTPAISADNELLAYFREMHFEIYKRAELLGTISQSKRTLAIAGTHGKTSISSMTAHIMQQSGLSNMALVGGIVKNYNSNLMLSGDPKLLTDESFFTVEADEYDRSFLKLYPEIALLSSVDQDHSDIYRNKNDIIRTFTKFANKSSRVLILNSKIEIDDADFQHKPFRYSIDVKADYYADNIRITDGAYHFDLFAPDAVVEDVLLAVPGRVNLENAVAASAVAHQAGVSLHIIKQAIENFEGVRRRFDIRFRNNQMIYIDDYAHHPEEIAYFVRSVKELFPKRKITGIFQPHLFSRTKDFYKDFGHQLSQLDEVFLMEIYPAREKPIHGINSELIFNHIQNKHKQIVSPDEILNYIKKNNVDVLLTMGAGNIDKLIDPIEKILKNKKNN